ncbi:MAG: polysulfide reductase NrfD [Fibrobacteria bacterium]|nr:polysulfide reductase NrfD [Fibrobacteria bacterium]
MSAHMVEDPAVRQPLVEGGKTFSDVTEIVVRAAEVPLVKTPSWWLISLFVAFTGFTLYVSMVGYLVWEGTGVWGLNSPNAWGWAIVNFVWWIGIGHAGTLISAILFLFRQKWRTGINRFAETMTVFAVCCAGLYPIIHIGRVWMGYYMVPLPNQMGMWPNFRSPLLWDVAAIGTYAMVSTLFWYMGLIPDLATLRDRATNKVRKTIYGLFSMGWRGANRHWQHYERAYLILAAVATPLVVSVHSVVSFDFSASILPGWHTTILPPYFVTGAVFSGFGLVGTLMIIAREIYGYKHIVTRRHMENMAKIMLTTGSIVGYAYMMELFIAWYSANPFERFAFWNRATGPYWWAYASMIICNVVIPQLFWFKKCRTHMGIIFVITIFINIGMWFERFVIVITLHADFLPSSWDYYRASWVDVCTFAGSFGLFFTLFLLFLRFGPAIALSEVKGVMPEADPHHGSHGGEH